MYTYAKKLHFVGGHKVTCLIEAPLRRVREGHTRSQGGLTYSEVVNTRQSFGTTLASAQWFLTVHTLVRMTVVPFATGVRTGSVLDGAANALDDEGVGMI